MKKFFAFMAAAMAFMAVVLTGCQTKLGDEDLEYRNDYYKQKSVNGQWSTSRNEIVDGVWYLERSYFLDNQKVDSVKFRMNLGSNIEMYKNDTTVVSESSVKNVSFKPIGENHDEYVNAGAADYTCNVDVDNAARQWVKKEYRHTLDKVEGVVAQNYQIGKVTINGDNFFSPTDRKASMDVVDFDTDPFVKEIGSDENHRYHLATMNYVASIDGNDSNAQGFKTLAINNEKPEDKLIDVEEGTEGFEPLTYDENGNLKTGRSWKNLIPVYSESGKHEAVPFEVVLNFSVKGVSRATEYGDNFDGIQEIGNGLTSETEAFNRNENEIKVYTMTSAYNSGVRFSGKDYNKSFSMSRERATVTYGGKTFNMPSPAFENVSTNFATTGLEESNGYERKLNTIILNGKINGKSFNNVKAETELLVHKAEDPETFTLVVVDSAFVYINPTTSDTRLTLQEVGNKGTKKTPYTVDVHVYNRIDGPASVTYDRDEFDTRSKQGKISDNDEYIGKRESGNFTIYGYKTRYTIGSETVDREFGLFYERAYHNPTGTWMMWKKYTNLTDNGFSTTDLSNQTSGDNTYLRKKYVYAMSAVYNGHSENATGEAILRVKVQEDNNRQTPSWLGAPQWADYTRVQKTEGAQFTDMIVFGYENGVVMAPNGKADLTNGVFAYDQSVADAHGVQKCAKGSCYTGVWKNNGWIPAKCETQNAGKSNETWVYTGKGASHSVMANNAVALGIGKDVTWNPKETVTISDGTISVKYSKNNASLNGNDLVSLK